jgi:hypothetical protein
MTDNADKSSVESETHERGPWVFVTRVLRRLPDGRHFVATSRRHRKGLQPLFVRDVESAVRPLPASAFRPLWAPQRLAWWIAILFAIGSLLFTVGGVAATWPRALPAVLSDVSVVNRIFVVGAIFFTSAAWLQWLEALNGDIEHALRSDAPKRWHWFGWRPRNLGYVASTIQLFGTLLFNFNTIDATFTDLSWKMQDLEIWTPNMLGCLCFLVASYLAFVEVSQGASSFAPRSLSWWVTVMNLLGSVAFQVSALYSFVGPEPAAPGSLLFASFYTAFGGLLFLAGSYLMIPEIRDEEESSSSTMSR